MKYDPDSFFVWLNSALMLATEKGQAYWTELGIPVDEEEFSDLDVFGIGCFELTVHSLISGGMLENHCEKSWKRYLRGKTVLSKDFLEENALPMDNWMGPRVLIGHVGEALNFKHSVEIEEWIEWHFFTENRSFYLVINRLEKILKSADNNDTNDSWGCLRKHYRTFAPS
ncbi:MAG: hypothetical protein R2684_16450 [Pyrinomonadaceae bacterium]